MPDRPAWRLGALGYALTLAGYWCAKLALPDPRAFGCGAERSYQPGERIDLLEPFVVREGAIGVYGESVGRRPARLGTIGEGWTVMPVGTWQTRPGLRFEAAGTVRGLQLQSSEVVEVALQNPESARMYTQGLQTALEAQHWALRLSAEKTPRARLVALLVAIAEDGGVQQEKGVYLAGAPEVREMSVLASVSRESAVINIEWLVHTGVLRREGGRLWAPDLDRLRAAGKEET
ncbi:MAG: hypothetical protein M3Q29_11990 [Chloroflexota bacterium]|nr:hypothetical protein [Chloroflexota bacterium]